jgi:hypothetical protein
MQLLARDGIGLPVTTFAHDPKQTEEVLKLAGGAPLVIKLLEGTQGIGVVLADTDRSAKSVIEAFRGAGVNILVQEFIKEAGGTDIRAHRGRRQGDRGDAAHRRRGRVPLEPASRRLGAGAISFRPRNAQPPCARPSRWGSMSAASTCCAPITARW